MTRYANVVAVLGGAFLCAAAWSQCPPCKWSDRVNRFEGVVTRPNSGGCCELLGVHYKRADALTENAKLLYLHFWVPADSSPEIFVWQPDLNYLMIPKSQRYQPGLQHFFWPRGDVLAPLGIQPDSLYLRVRGPGKVYYPALLSTSERPKALGSYAFVLESGDSLNVMCTIEREVEGRLTAVRHFAHSEAFGGVFTLEWDGRDDRGQKVPGGVYVLHLKGTLEAETIQRLDYAVSFQNYDHFQ